MTHDEDKNVDPPLLLAFVGLETTQVRQLLAVLPASTATPMATCLPTLSPVAVSLVEALLDWDPDRRLTAEQALEHPFVAPHHDPEDEVGLPRLQLPSAMLRGGRPNAAAPTAPVTA